MNHYRDAIIKSVATKVSIIIPTFNGADTINNCLENIFRQETPWKFDVNITNSGSSDKTLAVIKEYPVKLTEIPNRLFNHGKTRNEAITRVDGEFVVFLVQDAEPIGNDWLKTLVSAVSTVGAVGGFGSQLPRTNASLFTRWMMSRSLPVSLEPFVKESNQSTIGISCHHLKNSNLLYSIIRILVFAVKSYCVIHSVKFHTVKTLTGQRKSYKKDTLLSMNRVLA